MSDMKEKPVDVRLMIRNFYFKIWAILTVVVLFSLCLYFIATPDDMVKIDQTMTSQLKGFLLIATTIVTGAIIIMEQKRRVYKKSCEKEIKELVKTLKED